MKKFFFLLMFFVFACSENNDNISDSFVNADQAGDVKDGTAKDNMNLDATEQNYPPDIAVNPEVKPNFEVGIQKSEIGGVCLENDDCKSGYCEKTYYGGYCTLNCDENPDVCPDGTVCLKSPETKKKMCWKKCKTNADCRGDQFCAGNPKICIPKCQPGQCKNGYECNLDTGLCEYKTHECVPEDEVCGDDKDNDCNGLVDEGCGVSPTLVDGVEFLDLGEIKAGGNGLSYTVRFVVPQNTLSFTLVSYSKTPDLVFVWTLTNPQGELLLSGSELLESKNRSYPELGGYALLVPNNPQVTLIPGEYKFTLYKDGDYAPLFTGILFKSKPQKNYGNFGINFYFVGLPGLDASSAKYNSKFQTMVTKLKNIYKQINITINEINYYDITGSNAQKFTNLDITYNENDERFQIETLTGSFPKSKNINIFLVSDIVISEDAQGYYDALGIAGGIPGPPLFQGIGGSAIVVDFSDFYNTWYSDNDIANLYSETIGHEIGHQLGLFHTTEANGEMFDQLPDTPECPKSHDYNGDGVVDSQECLYQGQKYLMFWMVSWGVEITNDQKNVIYKNPAVY